MVTIENLTFMRKDKYIFNDVNITIKKGKITAIMGPSGSGKTTLLKLISGQIWPDAGKILVNSKDFSLLSRSELYVARRRLGLLFQSAALFSDMSVFENIAFTLREHTNLTNSMIRDLVILKLQSVGLTGAENLSPAQLSGGMARRVALARALALDPDLMMFDEPFSGQDPITMGVLVKLIKMLNDSLGMTTVIVSHDVHETLSIADYCYLIADGKVIGSGTKEEILNSDNKWVKQFVNGLADGPVPFRYKSVNYEEYLLGT